jgi:ribonuclease HI
MIVAPTARPAPCPAAGSDALWLIHCDGSAKPNPGPMGLGAVLHAPDGTRHTLSLLAHGKGCNNEAELRALMAALLEARKRGATSLLVHCDSTIVVEQLGAEAPKPIARLAALFDDARALLQSFGQTELRWIPRHRNAEADALARAALGLVAASPV